MSTVQQVLRRRSVERRAIGRTRINRGALLFFEGLAGAFSCNVRDATNLGAGIRLDGINVLPLDFELSFDNLLTIRRCHLIWRESDFIGATFLA